MAAEAAAAKYRDSMLIPAENAIDYTFHNYCLLLEALQAAGSSLQHIYPDGNKKLAMVGDAVMEVPLLEYLYTLNISRGAMNIISSEIVSNKNLDMIGRRNRIDSLVNRNPSQQGIVSEVTLTATVEAIIGAVYLDSGRSTAEVRRVMERLGLWPQLQQQ